MQAPVTQLHLYDLPKDLTTSVKIQDAFEKICGISLDLQPQINRSRIQNYFYTAIVRISDQEKFRIACEKMRYFDIDGKPCRALPFNREIMERRNLYNKDLFVKFPKTEQIDNKKFFDLFSQYGEVVSAKIAINEDYSRRNYGFVCFKEPESVDRALANQIENYQIQKIVPKDVLKAPRKMINNIYIKNIPIDKTEQDIKELFAPFGHISSCFLVQNTIGKFGFVCYTDPNLQSAEYGPNCAQKAIDEMNGREIAAGLKLIVTHALTKQQRDNEKKRDLLRYKQSKKRCNLYVKNIPQNWTEDNIKGLFSQFGEIENIKIGKLNVNSYAFVCFKEPDQASKAKINLQNYNVEGKTLIINFYEIKEMRKAEQEKAKDKDGWEKLQAQKKGGFNWNDLTSQPHLAQMLQSLLQIIQQNEQTNQFINQADRFNQRHNGRRNFSQNPRNYNNNQQFQGNVHQNNQQNQRANSQRVQQQPVQNMPQPTPQPLAPQMNMPMVPLAQMPIPQRYFYETQKIIPAVRENNPYLRDQVGSAIYEYIVGIAGPEKAPKITGMLIELPPTQIQQYLSSYEILYQKVQEANEHLMKASQTQK